MRLPSKAAIAHGAAALAAATLLSSCSSSGSTSAKIDHSGFHPNENRFATPIDDYQVTASDESGDDYDYATHLVVAKCMAGRGYHVNVADPANFQGAALAISVPLSVKRAARYGYHIGPVRGGIGDSLPSDFSPKETDAATACGKRAQAQIGLDLGLDNDVGALAFAADDAVQADDKVKAAARKWRECMLPLGVPDLPAEPVLGAMPTESQHQKFWPTGKPEYVPSDPDEVRQAVFDAKCRESSGWDNTYYRATIDHQFALMDQHADLMAKALDQKHRIDARIAAVLRSNGH